MRHLFVLAFLFSFSTIGGAADLGPRERAFAKRQAEQIQQEFDKGDLPAVAARVDQALNSIVTLAINKLHKKGEHDIADSAEDEWNGQFRGYLSASMAVHGFGDIGDHKPLIKWLADFYDKVEGALGVDACQFFHISDIKTFNFCIPIAFHPCSFDMGTVSGLRKDEYRKHMQKGAVYMGLLPVTVYWACDIACTFGTSGIGVLFCGPIASIAEMIMAGPISAKISDKIFDRACGPQKGKF